MNPESLKAAAAKKLVLYHLTSFEGGDRISREGFQDSSGRRSFAPLPDGVWFTDDPEEAGETLNGWQRCYMKIEVDEELIAPYLEPDPLGDAETRRDWNIPAVIANAHFTDRRVFCLDSE